MIDLNWHFLDNLRNRCTGIRGGSSGSPVIDIARGRVAGVISTSTEGALPGTECYLDHPCEIHPTGLFAPRDTNYAVTVHALSLCFRADGRFDLTQPDCPLDPGPPVTIQSTPARATQPYREERRVPLSIRLTAPGRSEFRYKIIPAAPADCRDPQGYSAPIALAAPPQIEERSRTGRLLLGLRPRRQPGAALRFVPPHHRRHHAARVRAPHQRA